MRSRKPVTRQLIEAAEKYGAGAVGTQRVSPEAIGKYSSLKISPLEERIFRVTDMNEKPAPDQVFSYYAILGRYVLPPAIFDILETVSPGYGGEIQLTDGLRELCYREPMVAVDFEGRRYDTGNLKGFLEATLDFALEHPEAGPWLREYMKKLAEER
jgi:UTP--glucose-1-phosphate uridylyltransferase